MIQNDTIVKYEKIPYSRLELASSTYKLDVPKVGVRELVYIPVHSLDTIYRDNIQFATLPRENYFTKTKDAEIWHSGIDSRIDSLNVFRTSTSITESIRKKTKRNSICLGIETNYSNSFSFPIQAQYSYKVLPWFELSGYAEYEIKSRQLGVGIGASFVIEY
jgi:hypothetical protein